MKGRELLIKLINNEALRKMIKYGIIGATSFMIDMSVTYYLKETLGLNKMLANTCGFCIGAAFNFLCNKFWSFRSDNNIYKEFVVFSIIALIGLTLNSLIILVCNDLLNINFYICKVIAVVLVFFWNFSMNYKFNFKRIERLVALEEEEEQEINPTEEAPSEAFKVK